jgi:hypothetical protein
MEREASVTSYVYEENQTNAHFEFYWSVLNAPKLIVAPMVEGSDFWCVHFTCRVDVSSDAQFSRVDSPLQRSTRIHANALR